MKTDRQLQQDISAELTWEPSVNAAQIGVAVKDGVVTLSGHVDSFGEKWHAEHAAQGVSGVKALAVEIDVKLPGSSSRNDTDIARTAENVLACMSQLPQDAIKVKVESGWVTLTGEVDWQFQRQSATAAVRYLMGTTGVSDQIVIKPRDSANVVKADIESALRRSARGGTHKISVDVSGGEVTLDGTVDSWAQRESAQHAAWGTPGVRNVVDRIRVAY
jgi:osmotically-inducible protein OsmY